MDRSVQSDTTFRKAFVSAVQHSLGVITLQKQRDEVFGPANASLKRRLYDTRQRLKNGRSALNLWRENNMVPLYWAADNAYFMALLVTRAWVGFLTRPGEATYGYLKTIGAVAKSLGRFVLSQTKRFLGDDEKSQDRRDIQAAWMKENYASLIRVGVLGFGLAMLPIVFPTLASVPLIAFPAGFIVGKPLFGSMLDFDGVFEDPQTGETDLIEPWQGRNPVVNTVATTVGGLRQAVTILQCPHVH